MSDQSSPVPCIHCGVPVASRVGGVPICDECYPVRGACCQEFGEAAHGCATDEEEETGTGFASPPCYAHLFENEDDEETVRPPPDPSPGRPKS